MSGPRTKRQFAGASSDPSQRHITSFFGPRQGSNSTSPASPQPILPPTVQSNLLSVGMRVRKSVPEGYKTGGHSSFKLWTDGDEFTSTRASPAPIVTQRELLPFCGIHSVGGLASQPTFEEDVPSLDDIPGLTSSQDSMDSRASVDSSRSRKRIYDDQDASDAPMRLWRDRNAWLDGEISPRSLVPVGWGNARPMAVPRKNRRKVAIASIDGVGQENMAVDDFEEADFLVGMDMDMSDV